MLKATIRMKTVNIVPRDKKEFDKALLLIMEFGKERKLLSLEDDEDISFAFLMNVNVDVVESSHTTPGKSSR
jgi:hypothetical protein